MEIYTSSVGESSPWWDYERNLEQCLNYNRFLTDLICKQIYSYADKYEFKNFEKLSNSKWNTLGELLVANLKEFLLNQERLEVDDRCNSRVNDEATADCAKTKCNKIEDIKQKYSKC